MSESDPASAPRGYDVEIRHLKERGAAMGGYALGMVHDGWLAFRSGDLDDAQRVMDRDAELDRLDEEMEHAAIAFLVLRQPTAIDLRTAAALLKITTHFHRMGRLGFDMARITVPRPAREPAEILGVLTTMDARVEEMVRQSIEALARDEVGIARGLFVLDDEVDRLHRQANRSIVRALGGHPSLAARLASELLAARHFERIADNACKVAEKTIYALTGQRRSEYLPRHPVRPYAREPPPERSDGLGK